MSRVAGTTDQWELTVYWTPTAAQTGQNIMCAKANDNVMLTSDLHCFTLLAGIYPPKLVSSSKSPSGTLTAAQLAGVNSLITWSIDFDQPISKPSSSAYINFHEASGSILFKIDVSIFPTVTISSNNVTLQFQTGNNFADGSYYITFDYGVGVGALYCQAQSDAERSNTFWTFTIASTGTTIGNTTLATATRPLLGITAASSTASPILPVQTATTLSTTTTTTAMTGTTTAATTTTPLVAGGTTASTASTVSSLTTTITLTANT